MLKPIISSDSHITEPPGTYVDRIDKKYKDTAPHMVHDDKKGDLFVINGMKQPVPMGLVAAAGKKAEELTMFGAKFEDLHRGGWDPEARLADQDRDGVAAEVIYPTVGMLLCNHSDFDYKKACFDAYNEWIAEYCSAHPDRLIGQGQTAMRSVDEGIDDIRKIKELGLRGVMMPGNPQVSDYDDPLYDPLWQAAVDMQMPLSFHILTSRSDVVGSSPRGPKLNGFLSIIRGNQDLMGTFILGGVFERNPTENRVRRSRRRLGAALYVPHGSCLRPAPLLAEARPGTVKDAERVFQRAYLPDLSGRLGSVPHERYVQPSSADVGQRLPAQRLDLAVVAGIARKTHLASHGRGEELDSARQRGPSCITWTKRLASGQTGASRKGALFFRFRASEAQAWRKKRIRGTDRNPRTSSTSGKN